MELMLKPYSTIETSRNITTRVIERDTSGEIYYFLEDSRGFRTHQHGRQNSRQSRSPTWSPKMMLTWLYRQDFAKLSLNRIYNGIQVTRKAPASDTGLVGRYIARVTFPLLVNGWKHTETELRRLEQAEREAAHRAADIQKPFREIEKSQRDTETIDQLNLANVLLLKGHNSDV
ncbi:hypothetical protein TNCV_3729411 [Trichonephila clavipes]|nr:hypothetical protein TNCV_3729411 [Trichonephila clavipes]